MATTQIRQRQIADGAINDAKVQAGANIATSKLADGANFIKKDGTVAMTGNLDLGNQKIVNVQTPSSGNDAANKTYVDTAVSNVTGAFMWKAPVRVATTGDISLFSPITNPIDGVTVVTNDRVLVRAQSAAAENGIYKYDGTDLVRDTDFNAWSEVPGAVTAVQEGTTLKDTVWLCTSNNGGTLGTTAITWQRFQLPDLGVFYENEVPTGAINGSNVTYTLAATPLGSSLHLYLNGQLLFAGVGEDFTISGATITMAAAPATGERLVATYRG